MAAASSYAWPSVVVYRGAMVAKRQTIVKCDRSDNFGALLEKFVCIMYDITSFYNDTHISVFFFKPTYRPLVFEKVAR